MNTSIYTAVQGFVASQVRLNKAAHNTANVNTRNFQPLEIKHESKSPSGVEAYTFKPQQDNTARTGTNLVSEKLDEILSLASVKANSSVIKAADEMIGSIINLKK